MPVFESQLNPRSAEFQANAAAMRALVDDLKVQVAKAAAGILLVQGYDDPAQFGLLSQGLIHALSQLEAEALKYRKYMFYGMSGAGYVCIDGARVGDDVVQLTGIYGLSGDQSAKFETEISEENLLHQTSSEDLSEYLFTVFLKSPFDDLVP